MRPASADVQWARIPAGTFQMGCVSNDSQCTDDEQPPHTVTLTNGYELMATAMTIGTFRTFALATRTRVPEQPAWNTNARQPVLNVTWDEARAACGWLGARLPTEAEWERAARGGLEDVRYGWGNQRPVAVPGAPNGARYQSKATVPVGTFGANHFGLFDMAGNAYQWTADWYAESYYAESPSTDPQGPATGDFRVVRGGAWGDDARSLRASYRDRSPPARRLVDIGVRCARDVPANRP